MPTKQSIWTGSLWHAVTGDSLPGVGAPAWPFDVDEPWRLEPGESLLDGMPSGVPVVQAPPPSENNDLYSIMQAVETTSGQPACYIQLQPGTYFLNELRSYGTNDWRGFSNVNRRVLGLIGAPFVAGVFSTRVQVTPGFVNSAAGARTFCLDPRGVSGSSSWAPVPIAAMYFSNTGTSVPHFFSGIDFRGTLQTPYGVLSADAQTKMRRNHGVATPLPWRGISLVRSIAGSRVQHCRFAGFAYAINTAPPYEMGVLDTNYGYETIRRCEVDGRIAADLDPARPLASGGIMPNKPIAAAFEDSYLHRTRRSGFAHNTNTNDQGERLTARRIRTKFIADPSDGFPGDNGAFPASNVEEMVGINRYDDTWLTSELADHLYLATPARINNSSTPLVLPNRPIIEVVNGFRTDSSAYGGCLVIGVSKQPNSTGISPAWQKIQDVGLGACNLFDVRPFDTQLTPVRHTAWNPSMTPATHYVVKYEN